MDTRRQKLHDYRLRLCIFQNVLDGKTLEEAYKNFCEEQGENKMEHKEFDFWFNHFYNGNDSLDCNKDHTPKPRTLSDLPIEIVRKLVDEVVSIGRPKPLTSPDLPIRIGTKLVDDIGLIDRLVLRKVSHYFQEIIDEKTIVCKDLSFSCYDNNATLHFENNQLIHFKAKEGGCQVTYCDIGRRFESFEKNGNYLKMAVNEFLLIIKQPKLQLNRVIIRFNVSRKIEQEKQLSIKYLNFIQSALKSLDHQIHINDVSFITDHLESVLAVFPYLKPGTLKYLSFHGISGEGHETVIDKLRKLDQWKQAVKVIGDLNGNNFSVLIEDLFWFTDFTGKFKSICNEDFIKIKDVLLKTTNVNVCYMVFEEQIDMQEMERIFNTVIKKTWHWSFRYTPHGTDKAYQFSVKPHSIHISTRFYD